MTSNDFLDFEHLGFLVKHTIQKGFLSHSFSHNVVGDGSTGTSLGGNRCQVSIEKLVIENSKL